MIAIASDHAGFAAKEFLKTELTKMGLIAHDFGCYTEDSVDYPIYGASVAKAVAKGECEFGILICGTGIGMSIVANKISDIRASLCHDTFSAKATRQHNDANILVMGARIISQEQMKEITEIWLKTEFEGGRHSRRLKMIRDLEHEFR